MTKRRLLAMATVLVVMGGGTFRSALLAQPREMGFSGKVEVRQVEAGYVPLSSTLRVRAHLATGMAVDYSTRDGADIDRILQMTHIFAAGKSRMFVEMEGGAIKTFHVSVEAARAGAF